MDYAEYRNMKDSGAVRPSAVYQNTTANYGEEIRKEQTTSKQPEEESLRIDDLPFNLGYNFDKGCKLRKID